MERLLLLSLLLLKFQGTIGITITNTLNNSSPFLGESITLSCNIADGGTVGVSWWKDKNDTERATYVSFNCSVVSEKYKLRLRNVQCDMNNDNVQLSNVEISDRGNWVCESDGQEAKTTLSLDVIEKPQTSLIGVKRAHEIVTVRWKPVIGKYTTLTIRYCQIGTENCWNHLVPKPDNNFAAFHIDANKTYDYQMIIENGGKVVYKSKVLTARSDVYSTTQSEVDPTAQSEVDDSTNTVFAVVYGLVGAGVVAITVIVVAVVLCLWRRRLVRRGKKHSHRPTKNTVDNDDTSISENQEPANDTVEYYNDTWVELTKAKRGSIQTKDPKGMPDHKPPQPMVMGRHVPVQGVLGNEPACPNDDVDAYDYVDSPTWEERVSGENPAPEPQENQTEDATAFAQIGRNVSSGKKREQEPGGADRSLKLPIQEQPGQSIAKSQSQESNYGQTTAKRGSCHAKWPLKRSPSRSNEDMAHDEESPYTPLGPVEPVKQGEYLYLRELSQ